LVAIFLLGASLCVTRNLPDIVRALTISGSLHATDFIYSLTFSLFVLVVGSESFFK
jgi:hypothetical protein